MPTIKKLIRKYYSFAALFYNYLCISIGAVIIEQLLKRNGYHMIGKNGDLALS